MEDANNEMMEERKIAYAADDEKGRSLRTMCQSNGISESDFTNRANEIQMLECFQEIRFSMPSCRWFTGLQEIWLIRMSCVKGMKDLKYCTSLRVVTISHCSIQKMEGLSDCVRLERLHLQGNAIRKIEGLERCVELKTLWLDDNEIEILDGLTNLTNLENFSIANNKIDQIGQALDGNSQLKQLNFSGNRFGSFQDILSLVRLSQLTHLKFGDPHNGECPVCHLANYQTYVLYNVPQIRSLDGLIVSDATKRLAEATFLKKKMYYNMRIKTIKRNLSDAIRQISTMERESVNKAEETAVRVHNLLANCERREHEWSASKAPPNARALSNELRAKRSKMEYALRMQRESIRELRDQKRLVEREATTMTQEMISRLIVELETGGNIRLEDGKPTNVWYNSCVDLVRSRFSSDDFKSLGITDARVRRVTRIHNRFLRNRFEWRMQTFLNERAQMRDDKEMALRKLRKKGLAPPSETVPTETDTSNTRRPLEYLFFSETPTMSTGLGAGHEMIRSVQEGFRSGREYFDMGMDAGVRLCGSLHTADGKFVSATSKEELTNRKLLIAKVFVG